jgi:hypothetical protein
MSESQPDRPISWAAEMCLKPAQCPCSDPCRRPRASPPRESYRRSLAWIAAEVPELIADDLADAAPIATLLKYTAHRFGLPADKVWQDLQLLLTDRALV